MDRDAAAAPRVGDTDPAGCQDEFDDMFAGVLAPAFVCREPDPGAYPETGSAKISEFADPPTAPPQLSITV